MHAARMTRKSTTDYGNRVERTLSDEKNAAIITKDIRQAFDSAIDEICDEAGIGLGKRPEKSDYFYG